MNRRQPFISESYYRATITFFDETPDRWANQKMQADTPEQELALRAAHFKDATLDGLFLCYTAGDPIEALPTRLEQLIKDYETYQHALAAQEQMPDISPLAIDDWPGEYEECVQVISLCILLHRTDLLQRFVVLLDNAGYAGDDTLYEDLLRKVLPNRTDLDEWYHDLYTPLIRAIYALTPEEASDLLKQYCNQWYSSFADLQTTWHDSHLDIDGDEGSYVGYWAFEAGAIAYLYNIDDSQIDHMVYPKDLVAYARSNTPKHNTPSPVHAGQPCPQTGYWFSPAQHNSRRHFTQGEIMPEFTGSPWGATIWYWSSAT